MKRVLRSAESFDRKLGNLFETLTGREEELQDRVDEVVKGLFDGTIFSAAQHHPSDDTCCLPLIDHYVIVFRPDKSDLQAADERRHEIVVNFRGAARFDLLDIEEEELQ